MRLDIIAKTLLVNMGAILFFSGIYYSLKDDFVNINDPTTPLKLIDFINLGLTIQSTIGISNIYPTGAGATTIMMIHEFLTMPSLFISGYLIHTL